MDNFHEQLIKTSKNAQYTVANAAFYVLGVLAIGFLTVNFIIAVVFGAMSAGLFFLKKKLYVEYEYYFTNGEIDIDVIMEMKSRKRLITFSAKDMELFAAENSTYFMDYSDKPKNEMVLYPKESTEKVFVAILSHSGEKKMLKLTPDEEFINLCYKYNPRAVKKN